MIVEEALEILGSEWRVIKQRGVRWIARFVEPCLTPIEMRRIYDGSEHPFAQAGKVIMNAGLNHE